MLENVGFSDPQKAGAADLEREVDRVLLSFYAPASIVVTRQFRVIGRRGNLEPFGLPGRFAKLPGGALGDAIRHGIETASQNSSATVEEIPAARINIIPIPAAAARRGLFLVIFE